nr:PLDc N-terminal domain-containing protein [Paracoccus bogoriensis]
MAIGAVGHTLVTKRDPRSATIWLLAILLLPLVGVALYVLFGINRYRRRAIRMREDHPRLAPAPSPDTATASATRNATRSQPKPWPRDPCPRRCATASPGCSRRSSRH